MFDLLMLVLLGLAFVGTAGYVWACAELTQTNVSAGDKTR